MQVNPNSDDDSVEVESLHDSGGDGCMISWGRIGIASDSQSIHNLQEKTSTSFAEPLVRHGFRNRPSGVRGVRSILRFFERPNSETEPKPGDGPLCSRGLTSPLFQSEGSFIKNGHFNSSGRQGQTRFSLSSAAGSRDASREELTQKIPAR